MAVRNLAHFTLGLLLALLQFACSDDSELNLGKPSIGNLPLTKLTATRNSEYIFYGNLRDQRQSKVLHQFPGSWSFLSQGVSDLVIIDEQAWERGRSGGWIEVPIETVESFVDAFLLELNILYNLESTQQIGSGPHINGEPTRKLRSVDAEYGLRLATSAAGSDTIPGSDGRIQIKDAYQDASAQIDLIVGNWTGRIYEQILEVKGVNIEGKERTVYDYKTPVVIKRPSSN